MNNATIHYRLGHAMRCAGVAVVLCLNAPARADRPKALLVLEESRRSLAGEIDWELEMIGHKPERLRFISRFATNGDSIFEVRGDERGYTDFENGMPKGRWPLLYLENGDGFWETRETSTGAALWRIRGPGAAEDLRLRLQRGATKVIRRVGSAPTVEMLRGDHPGIWNLGPPNEPATWSEEARGSEVIVTATYRSGDRIIWWLDADRQNNPVRVVREHKGETAGEARSQLRRYGETWFPAVCEYRSAGRPYAVVRVSDAQFGDAPRRFTPADIGMDPGVNVAGQSFQADVLIWNGDELCSPEEWGRDLESGKRRRGPWIQRMAEQRYDSPYMSDEERAMYRAAVHNAETMAVLGQRAMLWERYVSDFIRRFHLNAEQAAAAWRVHGQCLDIANQHLTKRRSEIEEAARALTDAQQKHDGAAEKAAQARIEKLMAPVDEIVEKQLKPRLDDLPRARSENWLSRNLQRPRGLRTPRLRARRRARARPAGRKNPAGQGARRFPSQREDSRVRGARGHALSVHGAHSVSRWGPMRRVRPGRNPPGAPPCPAAAQ